MEKSIVDLKEQKSKGRITLLLAHRILFVLHAFLYLAVMALLVVIWLVTLNIIGLTGITSFWPLHAMFGWGFAVGAHALAYLMFNDKVAYLTKVRKESLFGILFVFHAWFYSIINVYLIVLNIGFTPTIPWVLWPLLLWGLGFTFHAFGFFTWNMLFTEQLSRIRAKFPEYSEKHSKRAVNLILSQFWFLFAHIAYFVVGNILIPVSYIIPGITVGIGGSITNYYYYTLGNWSILLGLHVLSYYLFAIETKKRSLVKLFYLNIIGYIAYTVYFIILQFTPMTTQIWIQFPLVLWGIVIAVHAFIVYKWDKLIADATQVVRTRPVQQLEEFEIYLKGSWLIFWQWTLIAHILVYVGGLILFAIQFAIYGIVMTVLVHIAMGWLIGVFVHGSFFIIIYKQIRAFLMWTATIHLSVYIPTCVYLVILNLMVPVGVLWSPIAILGWGIGLGFHLLLAYLTKKK